MFVFAVVVLALRAMPRQEVLALRTVEQHSQGPI